MYTANLCVNIIKVIVSTKPRGSFVNNYTHDNLSDIQLSNPSEMASQTV